MKLPLINPKPNHYYDWNRDATGTFIEEFLDFEARHKTRDLIRGLTMKQAKTILTTLPRTKTR